MDRFRPLGELAGGVKEAELADPGEEGTFGDVLVHLQALVTNIGLKEDSNHNLTQRMLLLLESTAVSQLGVHAVARRTVLEAYLEPPIKGHQPPRLLLNDLVRYWRTMCVDFAGKMRKRNGQGWGLRNVKLRTTRKVLFASGLLPVLRCADMEAEAIPGFLHDQFSLPPADRVAAAFLALGCETAGKQLFEAYDRFLVRLDDRDLRQQLDALPDRLSADGSHLFQDVARLGDEIEDALLQLLFETKLAHPTRRFGIF